MAFPLIVPVVILGAAAVAALSGKDGPDETTAGVPRRPYPKAGTGGGEAAPYDDRRIP